MEGEARRSLREKLSSCPHRDDCLLGKALTRNRFGSSGEYEERLFAFALRLPSACAVSTGGCVNKRGERNGRRDVRSENGRNVMEWLVGALAFGTLAIVIVFVASHFFRQLRDPKNKDAAKNAIVEDGSSAHTAVRGGNAPDHMKD
jgi:hypothetical protein